jgi:hopene-associated glycosyltransferase HpnB
MRRTETADRSKIRPKRPIGQRSLGPNGVSRAQSAPVTHSALVWTLLAGASLAAWLHLVFARGRYWMGDQRLSRGDPEPPSWPAVCAIVPARNEAPVVAHTVGSLLGQDYPGPLRVILVDDESEDGTAEVARAAAEASGRAERFEVRRARPRPEGWVGKMWAVATGVALAGERFPETAYLWLSDADVAAAPTTLRRLVARAEADRLDLVSLMVKLRCESAWERLLIPAFVYFFQKLYPFPLVNDPGRATAAAAGGCALVRADALKRAGGIESIRGAVIDDCALGTAIKRNGPIWIGLAEEERSVRPYTGLGEIWDMVARSAYDQLRYSPVLLLGTLVGLGLLYVVPWLALLAFPLHGSVGAAWLGGAAWLALSITFLPTLALYGLSPLRAPTLPLAGVLYAGMTFDSAWRHHRGRGTRWKGRSLTDTQH